MPDPKLVSSLEADPDTALYTCILYINEYPIVYFNADPNQATAYTYSTVSMLCTEYGPVLTKMM